jgi:hypothetical protein
MRQFCGYHDELSAVSLITEKKRLFKDFLPKTLDEFKAEFETVFCYQVLRGGDS